MLRGLGIEFTVVPADVDESIRPGEKAIDYVERVARDKALAVVGKLGMGAVGDVVVLAADTTVDVDGEVLAKPVDDADAQRMLRLLSGRTHQVHTAVVGWRITGMQASTVTTDVTFVALDEATIDWYLSTGRGRRARRARRRQPDQRDWLAPGGDRDPAAGLRLVRAALALSGRGC